jgi:hypothetical protein
MRISFFPEHTAPYLFIRLLITITGTRHTATARAADAVLFNALPIPGKAIPATATAMPIPIHIFVTGIPPPTFNFLD